MASLVETSPEETHLRHYHADRKQRANELLKAISDYNL